MKALSGMSAEFTSEWGASNFNLGSINIRIRLVYFLLWACVLSMPSSNPLQSIGKQVDCIICYRNTANGLLLGAVKWPRDSAQRYTSKVKIRWFPYCYLPNLKRSQSVYHCELLVVVIFQLIIRKAQHFLIYLLLCGLKRLLAFMSVYLFVGFIVLQLLGGKWAFHLCYPLIHSLNLSGAPT